MNILIVDDEALARSRLRTLLDDCRDAMPTTVTEAASASEALARLSPNGGHAFDLVLLDIHMPGQDGLALAHAMQALAHPPAVVFVTAHADHAVRAFELDAVDYLTKPVRPGVLLARVAAQLARHNAARRQHAAVQALQADVQRLQGDLDTALGVTLQTLLHLQDARDPGAALHRQRTQAYLHSLCQVLRRHPRFAAQLDDRQIGLLLRAAPLHDIGLLAVPDRVLDKPGPLDAAERQLVQGHAQAGAELLARMLAPPAGTAAPAAPGSWLHWAQQIALGHHERWDGQGYPQGLAGDAIDWPLRLMAVVDTYDALTARRPHRQALAHADAAAVVAAGRGQQFDPDVTDAFLEVCDDWPAMGLRHV